MRSAFGVILFSFTCFLSCVSTTFANSIETFDTSADMNALLDLDVFAGDGGTAWRNAPDAGFSTPSVHFNSYFSPNSISLKDNNLSILSFEFSEYTHERDTGNNWTWSFYDAADVLIGSLGYSNTGDSSIQTMDLLSLGFLGVNTVQLVHEGGWINIDNLESTAVPIPAAVWLFGSALAGLGWMRRKQVA